jgi:hypothetical protein
MNCMRFTKSLLAGLLLTGLLAIAPDKSFAHGGGGGHFGGGGGGAHFGGFHTGFAGHGFTRGGRGDARWHNGAGWYHHGYGGYYGYYGPFDYEPFDYGLDDPYGYVYPYNDNDGSFDAQPTPGEIVPEVSTARTVSVQKALTRLGYYHGPIDGIAGSQTEHAIRWFQSVDKLPATGRIDGATLQALAIG